MKNIWDAALTNEELNLKFKGILGEYYQNLDIDYVGTYLIELQCSYYHHEFVRKAILIAMENDEESIEACLKLLLNLNVKYNVKESQI
jgi:hypothetical protein